MKNTESGEGQYAEPATTVITAKITQHPQGHQVDINSDSPVAAIELVAVIETLFTNFNEVSRMVILEGLKQAHLEELEVENSLDQKPRLSLNHPKSPSKFIN